ncbi:hypothetical protein CONCODRAFT_140595 [Conidiobolus coronatus NRRL 28638]|uniref:Uncharacterized protein n=1 Tax=Conidiobolus coronatus (strain ATCC 28846 / CBS 209.66 / NRRL 28638) TaxID=796925 RepID=A0A137PAN8_CONC2|nr:hypothetical protein CONCODRAFT_140595 [Conidiobolus coronatus NRRL 28638]|eukprot:KXN72045.1 hypothetical protein CONCODRAFT_140595 [Conidiobolus coronatus NRRL 28638]
MASVHDNSVTEISRLTDAGIQPDSSALQPERGWKVVQICRSYKIPSFAFPGIGIVYAAFHPIHVGKVMLIPVLKCGVVALASYPVTTVLISKYYSLVRKYVGPSYPGATALMIAGWGIIRAGWLHYMVLDPLLRRDRKKLLHATVEDLQPKELKASEGLEPIDPPYLRRWRISSIIANSLSSLIGLVLPKTSRGFRGYVLRRLFTLPFYIVPIIGPILFSFVNSVPTGQRLIRPYLKHHLNLKPRDQDKWLKRYSFQLRWFGFVADLLETLPGVGILFTLTNTVGAAIWVSTYHPISVERELEERSVD